MYVCILGQEDLLEKGMATHEEIPWTEELGELRSIWSVPQLCLTLYDPMNHSTPGLPVHHQPPAFTQTHAN